ncbi:erythromycin esterase family protein [Halalkalibacter urbisdiaboli]|uniref:erythromycin esterase family protein n=1 Tax=Halalkalibacter urbisdiaboli TaxID=1960589 RepID=UPI000B434A79|nr:erythromycin esterase family protein [Halalkalibacter urbisdiaboli]
MLKDEQEFIRSIKENAIRFDKLEDMEPLLEEASKARFALLGEASHGTSEYYKTRAEMSKWLIEKKGFSFLAVEGDWPSCYEINRYIKGYSNKKGPIDVLNAFNRWPTWMWANEEMIDLIAWLKDYNDDKAPKDKVGFYGIDVYSLWESMEAVIAHLDKTNSPAASHAKKAFSCFEPFHRDAQSYGVSAALYGEDCINELMEMLRQLYESREFYEDDDEASLNVAVNALVAKNAEAYCRTMITNDNESWNIRDRHMVAALDFIADYYGPDSKGVIWEHNTHIGDARATDMAEEGLVNVGQLTREKYGVENVYAVGFGTFEGTVIAADRWGEKAQVMQVPKGRSGSWEEYLHEAGAFNKYILFHEMNRPVFEHTIGHRAIGVSYNPRYEHYGNYVPTKIARRYDAFLHFEQTHALHPLNVKEIRA